MPTIVHFEIPADNVERARSFYSKLFGWEIKEIPGMDYWIITTTGEKSLGGGTMKRQNPGQPIISKYPPAEPGALRLLAPQRGLIAIGQNQN
jgi:predicted enzyme related to lactoylglutathione lyase